MLYVEHSVPRAIDSCVNVDASLPGTGMFVAGSLLGG